MMETTARIPASPPIDPVIDAYKPGIDRSIIRHNLQLTIEQRIDALQALMQSIEQMQEMGRRARQARR
jgi:hypothetical protein